LIVGDTPVIQFAEHVLVTDDKDTIKRLESSSWKNKSYYRVLNKAGDDKYQEKAMKYLRDLITGDPMDEVKTERGLIATMSLFDQSELDKLEVSRSMPNVDRLILAVIKNKKIEGIE